MPNTAGRARQQTAATAGRVREQTAAWVKEQIAYIYGMYAYAYGFPLVMMDVTRQVMTAAPRSGEYSAPVNQFHRIRDFVSPDFKNVVRISRNSLWSTAFLDLDAEPAVFSHPATNGRYLVAQVMDMWTDNFASIGSRTTGEEPGHCLIAGRDRAVTGRTPRDPVLGHRVAAPAAADAEHGIIVEHRPGIGDRQAADRGSGPRKTRRPSSPSASVSSVRKTRRSTAVT
jgi:hypothetical protein